MTITKACTYCEVQIDAEIWEEELGMCVECSHKYYDGEMD